MVKRWKKSSWAVVLGLALTSASGFAAGQGTVIRETALYSSAGANSPKLGQVERGRALTVLEQGTAEGKPWLKVAMAADQQAQVTRELAGWVPGQAVITASTSNGDQIIFGEAVASERQAEERGGRKGAADDAMRLYARVPELFPSSPLAAEALWRSADVRWQLAKAGSTGAEPQLEEKYLNEVIARFPQSKQAALAAYDLIDAKLCSEWRGLAECPQKESALFEQYAREHPQSPKAAEALYNAAWRQAALADIYRIENDAAKSDAARKKATALAQEIAGQHQQDEWKPRAIDLIYKLEKKIPLYGLPE